ncbi:MAG TPA: DUF4258 domain-containing protein [Pyrinomonadaceae bacterium]|nr:DUF4258 domain-containing protein [Pyrinomonadaceae bacterium]
MTVHAMEEMAEDDLDILDVEEAVLNGHVVRRNGRDPLGPKYTVEGLTLDGEKLIGIVGRFTSTSRFLIITVYEIHEAH